MAKTKKISGTDRTLARIKALTFSEKRSLVFYLQGKLRENGKKAASKCMRLRHAKNIARARERGKHALDETCIIIENEFLSKL